MKRFLIAVAVLIIVALTVSLGGIILDEVNRVFWTQSLIWTALSTLVLAPILVFSSGSRASSSSKARQGASASPTASVNQPAPFVSEAAASNALSPSVPKPASTGASSKPASSKPLSRGTRSDVRKATPAGPSATRPTSVASAPPKRSAGRTAAYVVTGGILLWLVVSLAGIFVDQANLAFWTTSLMWTLLAIILWGPALAFIVNPMKKAVASDPVQPGEANATLAPVADVSRSDGAELEREVPPSVPENEKVDPAPAPPALSSRGVSPSLRTPTPASSAEPEWPIWPDDKP